ncbi:hypothetical protein B6A27_04970 [Anoxybacillus sp. UARK-01]|nr:hypothetical protein B6A27_04970 [Anoxybacillus sp. UARK-01]
MNIGHVPIHTLSRLHKINYPKTRAPFLKGGVIMGAPVPYAGGFALIVVLFILLIIVGSAWWF